MNIGKIGDALFYAFIAIAVIYGTSVVGSELSFLRESHKVRIEAMRRDLEKK